MLPHNCKLAMNEKCTTLHFVGCVVGRDTMCVLPFFYFEWFLKVGRIFQEIRKMLGKDLQVQKQKHVSEICPFQTFPFLKFCPETFLL